MRKKYSGKKNSSDDFDPACHSRPLSDGECEQDIETKSLTKKGVRFADEHNLREEEAHSDGNVEIYPQFIMND